MNGPIVIPEDWNHADRMAAHFADRAIWRALVQLRTGSRLPAYSHLSDAIAQLSPGRPIWARPREEV